MSKCTDCGYCIMQDTGYSNYTVEGTDVDCLLNLNMDFPKDNWYSNEDSLNFANKCPRFSKGDPIEVDVDQEEGDLVNYTDDPEVKQLLESWDK